MTTIQKLRNAAHAGRMVILDPEDSSKLKDFGKFRSMIVRKPRNPHGSDPDAAAKTALQRTIQSEYTKPIYLRGAADRLIRRLEQETGNRKSFEIGKTLVSMEADFRAIQVSQEARIRAVMQTTNSLMTELISLRGPDKSQELDLQALRRIEKEIVSVLSRRFIPDNTVDSIADQVPPESFATLYQVFRGYPEVPFDQKMKLVPLLLLGSDNPDYMRMILNHAEPIKALDLDAEWETLFVGRDFRRWEVWRAVFGSTVPFPEDCTEADFASRMVEAGQRDYRGLLAEKGLISVALSDGVLFRTNENFNTLMTMKWKMADIRSILTSGRFECGGDTTPALVNEMLAPAQDFDVCFGLSVDVPRMRPGSCFYFVNDENQTAVRPADRPDPNDSTRLNRGNPVLEKILAAVRGLCGPNVRQQETVCSLLSQATEGVAGAVSVLLFGKIPDGPSQFTVNRSEDTGDVKIYWKTTPEKSDIEAAMQMRVDPDGSRQLEFLVIQIRENRIAPRPSEGMEELEEREEPKILSSDETSAEIRPESMTRYIASNSRRIHLWMEEAFSSGCRNHSMDSLNAPRNRDSLEKRVHSAIRAHLEKTRSFPEESVLRRLVDHTVEGYILEKRDLLEVYFTRRWPFDETVLADTASAFWIDWILRHDVSYRNLLLLQELGDRLWTCFQETRQSDVSVTQRVNLIQKLLQSKGMFPPDLFRSEAEFRYTIRKMMLFKHPEWTGNLREYQISDFLRFIEAADLRILNVALSYPEINWTVKNRLLFLLKMAPDNDAYLRAILEAGPKMYPRLIDQDNWVLTFESSDKEMKKAWEVIFGSPPEKSDIINTERFVSKISASRKTVTTNGNNPD